MTNAMHPFEVAGLGKAPFKWVGCREELHQPHPGAPTKPGASCHCCWTSIAEVHLIKSSDGKVFKVGNVCVEKTYRKLADDAQGLSYEDRLVMHKAKRAHNKLLREKKAKRDESKLADVAALLTNQGEKIAARLLARDHPKKFKNMSLADYVCWMLANAGMKGRLEIATLITEIAK